MTKRNRYDYMGRKIDRPNCLLYTLNLFIRLQHAALAYNFIIFFFPFLRISPTVYRKSLVIVKKNLY